MGANIIVIECDRLNWLVSAGRGDKKGSDGIFLELELTEQWLEWKNMKECLQRGKDQWAFG